MTPFSQKDSTIEALKQREISLLEQLKFAVDKNDAKDEQVKLLRDSLARNVATSQGLYHNNDHDLMASINEDSIKALAATGSN